VANVKASAILARIDFIKRKFGEEGYQEVLQGMLPTHRTHLEGLVLPQAWLPVSVMVDLIKTTESKFGNGGTTLCEEMARYSADANLKTLYRLFFRITSASYVLGKAKALWRLHYDSGSLELEERTATDFSLSIVDFDQPDCAHCNSVFAWAKRSIEMSGGRDVQRSVRECRQKAGAACRCQLTFR